MFRKGTKGTINITKTRMYQAQQLETRHADGYAHLTDCETINPKHETHLPPCLIV